jgi:hypothetical protein
MSSDSDDSSASGTPIAPRSLTLPGHEQPANMKSRPPITIRASSLNVGRARSASPAAKTAPRPRARTRSTGPPPLRVYKKAALGSAAPSSVQDLQQGKLGSASRIAHVGTRAPVEIESSTPVLSGLSNHPGTHTSSSDDAASVASSASTVPESSPLGADAGSLSSLRDTSVEGETLNPSGQTNQGDNERRKQPPTTHGDQGVRPL